MISGLYSNGEKGFTFDFSALSGDEGDPVSFVLDQSGNNNNISQPSLLKKPKLVTFGGKNGLSFDGIDDALVGGNVNLSGVTTFTLLLAILYHGEALGVPLEYGSSPYTGVGGFGVYFNNGQQALGSGLGSSAVAYSFINCPESREGVPTVLKVVFKPNANSIYERQELSLSGERVLGVNASSVGVPNTSLFTNSNLYIGGRLATSYFAKCELFGIVGIGRELDSQESSDVEAWLQSKLPPEINKSRQHFNFVGSLTRTDWPTHVETDSFSYVEFSTQSTIVEVESYSTLAGLYPALSEIGVIVNGSFLRRISHTVNGALKTSVALPSGTNTVRFVTGPQARSSGLPGQPWYGTWLKSFKADCPLLSLPSKEKLFIYGDSIATGAWAIDVHQNAWIPKVRNTLSMEVMSKAIGSQTLFDDCATPYGIKVFVDKIAKVAPTVIWLTIGTNDFGLARWSAVQFGEAYAALLEELHIQLPWVKVYTQTPLIRTDVTGVEAYRDAINMASQGKSWVKLVDGTTILTPQMLQDGLHPNTEGHTAYATYVVNKINSVW